MATFIGREQLESNLHSSMDLSHNDTKGLEGELKVGDLLTKHLPDDTYVIAHPSIGKYDPDFLIISPRYGFRLLEVKNWSINNISSVYSNGAMRIASDDRTRNPLSQVKKHIDEFSGYLKSLKISNIGDPYKLVGFAVIHIGFNKTDMQQKISNWNPANRQDFFKYHLFADQLDNNIDYLLEKATKYPYYDRRTMLSASILQQIVDSVTISDENTYDNPQIVSETLDAYGEAIKDLKTTLATIQEGNSEQVKELSPSSTEVIEPEVELPPEEKNTRQGRGKKKKNKLKVFIPVVVLLVLGIGAIWAFLPKVKSDTTKPTELAQSTQQTKETQGTQDTQDTQDSQGEQPVSNNTKEQNNTTEPTVSNPTYTNVSDLITNANLGDYVELKTTVQQFTYDQGSGTKFIILTDGQTQMDAVIFKGTDVPFINEGDTYTFKGEYNEYKGKKELIVNSVD
ncbi:NERD domain-containing protein [Priestia megaterium]